MKSGKDAALEGLAQKLLIVLIISLPAIILLPGLTGFFYPGDLGSFSDISISHYPYAIYLRDVVARFHQIPLWSSLFFSGSPFAANPLSGLWYPPGWLALFLPLPFGFNLLVIIHLVLGGSGIYALIRSEGLSKPAALLAGVLFAALPKLYAHFGAGHLTFLYAVPWTPWLLLASRRGWRLKSPQVNLPVITWEVPILALIFYADPRWAAYAGIIWWAYSLSELTGGIHDSLLANLFGSIRALLLRTILVGLMVAPLFIPLMEFTHLSTRSSLLPEEALVYSLPWARLLGIAVPDIHGFHEFMLYTGQLALILSFAAVLYMKTDSKIRFWFLVAVGSLVFSLGENFPLVSLLARLPFLNILRVPGRSLFLFGISLAALAGHGLDRLMAGARKWKSPAWNLGMVVYLALLAGFAVGFWFLTGELQPNFSWAAGWALAGFFWIKLFLNSKLTKSLWLAGIFSLCILELCFFNGTLFHVRTKADVLSEGKPVARKLQTLAGENPFRIYSPSYSIPQQTAAELGLELADGVDPLHLASYSNFMEAASGIPPRGYSVTLPSFPNGDPRLDNKAYLPNAELLGKLNVRFVVSQFALDADGLIPLDKADGEWIYQNDFVRPRAWVEHSNDPYNRIESPVQDIRLEPDRVFISAIGPGLLVLSEVIYPGWDAWVDGEKAEVQPYMGLLRSVPLIEGEHQVIFSFRPVSLYVGLAIGLPVWTLVLFSLWIRNRNKLPSSGL